MHDEDQLMYRNSANPSISGHKTSIQRKQDNQRHSAAGDRVDKQNRGTRDQRKNLQKEIEEVDESVDLRTDKKNKHRDRMMKKKKSDLLHDDEEDDDDDSSEDNESDEEDEDDEDDE